jgi:hypothetical protein
VVDLSLSFCEQVDDDEDERADQSGSEVSAAESNGLSALDRDLDREERGDRSSRTSKPKRPKKSSRDYESDEDDDPLDAMERAAEENAQAQRREAKERRKREKERQKEERAGESRWLRSRTVLMTGWWLISMTCEIASPVGEDEETAAPMDVDDDDIPEQTQTVHHKRVLRYEDEDDE